MARMVDGSWVICKAREYSTSRRYFIEFRHPRAEAVPGCDGHAVVPSQGDFLRGVAQAPRLQAVERFHCYYRLHHLLSTQQRIEQLAALAE
jgi:hypothetical protein